MNSLETHYWQLQPGTVASQVIKALDGQFSVEMVKTDAQRVTLLDDHDWGIWTSGKLLVRSGKNAYQLYGNEKTERLAGVKANARFWWDFPESTLRDQLRNAIDLRAILPKTDIEVSEQPIVVRNDDEKIVVRGKLTTVAEPVGHDRMSSHFLELTPLRGYQKSYQAAVQLLAPCLSKEQSTLSMKDKVQFLKLGPVADGKPGGFGINADETVEQAIRQMSLNMLAVARSNEQGVIDDVDTEFLHHYRVSLRKTRSLLNLMKKALPVEMHLRLKALLAELAGATNMLRDMDVFLLERGYYQSMLPDNFAAGVEALFKLIAADREKARKSVHKSFQSDKHHQAFDEVIALLAAEPVYVNELARKPVLLVAKKKVLNRYQRISLLGAGINDATPDEEVHELRIECKKLRYLMEFFAELFPKKRVKSLIKSLKQLQNILGNFNDYAVQKDFLANYEKNHKKSARLSAAINGLIAVLHQKQIHERSKVQEAFADFNDDQIAAEFTALFGKYDEVQS